MAKTPVPNFFDAVALRDAPKTTPKKWRSKFEPWMTEVVCNATRKGMPLNACSGLVGVRPGKLSDWYRQGCDPLCQDDELIAFSIAVYEARSEAVDAGVQALSAHAAMDWRAADRMLQVVDPENFQPAKSTIDVNLKPPPARDLSKLSTEELLQLEALENKLLSSGE